MQETDPEFGQGVRAPWGRLNTVKYSCLVREKAPRVCGAYFVGYLLLLAVEGRGGGPLLLNMFPAGSAGDAPARLNPAGQRAGWAGWVGPGWGGWGTGRGGWGTGKCGWGLGGVGGVGGVLGGVSGALGGAGGVGGAVSGVGGALGRVGGTVALGGPAWASSGMKQPHTAKVMKISRCSETRAKISSRSRPRSQWDVSSREAPRSRLSGKRALWQKNHFVLGIHSIEAKQLDNACSSQNCVFVVCVANANSL